MKWLLLAAVSGLLAFSGLGCTSSKQETSEASLESVSSLTSVSPSFQENEEIKQIEPLAILDGINLGQDEILENNHLHQGVLYFEILNNRYSMIYPTLRQYKYDFNTQQTTLLKERNVEDNERVWDFFENDGILYESVVSFQDDTPIERILVNGTPIWSTSIPDAAYGPTFSFWDGHIYFMTSFFEQDQMVSELFLINGQNVEPLWSSNSENGESMIIRAQTQDDYTPLLFETNAPNGKQIYFFTQNTLQSVFFEEDVMRFESLGQNSLLISRKDAYNPQEMQYHLLNRETLEIRPISSSNPSIGALNAGGGALNTFLFVNQDQGTSIARLQEDALSSQTLDVPSGVSYYWTLDEKQNVIFVDSYEVIESGMVSHPQYFLLTWK